MIVEYHRPKSIDAALALLARPEPHTIPLAGGTVVSQPSPDRFAVVDLQDLGLDHIERRGKEVVLGAAATLQSFAEVENLPPALVKAIQHEATYNLRQAASIAGTLISSDGRSPLTTALLALDAQLRLLPGDETISLGDLLPLRSQLLRSRLVTQVRLSLNAVLAYEFVARTPADLPVVCAAAARWSSGRTRLALGGFGPGAVLAFDGPDASGVEVAARSAYADAGDEWASAEYRQDIAAALARRCLVEMPD
jgi:CO/xanthine dehydrogenase FAD-binding subunit